MQPSVYLRVLGVFVRSSAIQDPAVSAVSDSREQQTAVRGLSDGRARRVSVNCPPDVPPTGTKSTQARADQPETQIVHMTLRCTGTADILRQRIECTSMGKFCCTCGNVVSDVACPNEVTGDVLSDKSAEAFFDALTTITQDYLHHLKVGTVDNWRAQHFNEIYPDDLPGSEMIHDVLTSKLGELSLAMFECDQCARLWVQTKPGVNDYRGYSPDAPDARVKVLGFNQVDPDTTQDA